MFTKILKLIFFAAFVFSSHPLVAGEQILLKISNDEDSNITKFYVVTDDSTGNIVSFREDETSPSGSVLGSLSGTPSELAGGIVLCGRNGQKIVEMISTSFDAASGGAIDIRYLYNGITGEMRSFPVEIVRYGDQWNVVDGEQNEISSLHFKSRIVLWKTIGVERIIAK